MYSDIRGAQGCGQRQYAAPAAYVEQPTAAIERKCRHQNIYQLT
jgi:hypothetical protein